MPNPANLVHETATATGTGNITVTAVNGKQRFSTAFSTGGTNVFDYFISNRDAAEWERGTGHMEDVNTLVRDEAIETSGGSTVRISFTAGTKDITNDVPALRQVYSTTIGSSGFMPTFTTTRGNELQPSGVMATTAAIFPATNDGVALGTSALKFSDLHLASGGVLQFSTEGTNITHAASQLTVAASSLFFNSTNFVVNAVTADIGAVKFTTNAVRPATNDGVAIGSSALKFSDLYLADGGVINFSTGEQGGSGARIVHAASQLAVEASTVLVAGSVRVTTSLINPTSNDGVALGTSALKFSDLYLASGAVVQFSTEATNITHSASVLTIAASTIVTNSIAQTTAAIYPVTNDGVTLGTSANKFADLFLASGGVLQFSTEGTNITHSASVLTIAASTIVTNSIAQSTAAIYPVTNDGVTLGTSANKWADLYLASGAVIDFSTGNATITHQPGGQITIACSTVAVAGSFSVSSLATIGGVLTLTTGALQFPASWIENANANILDDYEEGTFAPTFTPATTGTFTIGYAAGTTGYYVKIGRAVYVMGLVSVTTLTSGTGSGQMGIGSLPSSVTLAQGVMNIHNPSVGTRAPFSALPSAGLSLARVQIRPNTTSASSSLTLADLTTGTNTLNFSGMYFTGA